jgi:hypothetical protein
MSSDIKILQSKLDRNFIPFEMEDEKLTINKTSGSSCFGIFIAIGSLLFSIAIFGFMFTEGFDRPRYLFIIAIFTGVMGIFYLSSLRKKNTANTSKKILHNHTLQVEDQFYDVQNTKNFYAEVTHVKNDVHQGTLFLEDTSGNKLAVLAIREETESIAKSEMKWIVSFFNDYLKL